MTHDDEHARPDDAADSNGCSMIAEATTIAGDRFNVELVAAGGGPPWPIRMRRWLKVAGRVHGLTCVGVAGVSNRPTGHLPQTNAPGNWRPRGRGIRRAAPTTTPTPETPTQRSARP